MSSDKRPGGLTALAVINFIFGGLSILGALGMVALIFLFSAMSGQLDNADIPPEDLAQIEALADLGAGMFVTLAIISLASAILLIASGVGYLKLKKFLGRTLGNVYAVTGIIAALWSAVGLPVELGGGFNLMAIVNLIYPVLTLFLLNVTFKEDFVN